MPKFQTMPACVEAVQYTGSNEKEIGYFAGLDARLAGRDLHLQVTTRDGVRDVKPKDWIVKESDGVLTLCGPDIFIKRYQVVPEKEQP